MSKSGSLIIAPVGLAEMAETLSVVQDIGVVCTASSINKWAKYKPVMVPQFEAITLQQRQAVNYGLTIPYKNSPYGLFDSGFDPEWKYNRPYGAGASVNYPFRLSDFNGYYHAAPSPVPTIANQTVRKGTDGKISITVPATPTVLNDNALALSDLKVGNQSLNFASMYLGVVLKLGNYIYFHTRNTTGMGGGTIEFTDPGLSTGTYQALLFACSQIEHSNEAPYKGGLYVPFDRSTPAQVIISRSVDLTGVAIQVRARLIKATSTTYSIEADIIFENQGNTSYNFQNMYLYALSSGNITGSNPARTLGSVSLGTVAVASKGTQTLTKTITGLTTSDVWVYASSGSLAGSPNSGNPTRPAILFEG